MSIIPDTLVIGSSGDAPVGTSLTINAPAGDSYALQKADFGFTDPNDYPYDTFTAVKITTLPTDAVLTLSSVAVTEGQFVSVDDIVAGNLVVTPGARNHRVNFTFQVQDNATTTNGGVNLDPDPKTLTLNFAPVAGNDSYVVLENQTLDQAFLGNHYRIIATNTTYDDAGAAISEPAISQRDYDGSGGLCTVTMNGNGVTFTFASSGINIGGFYLRIATAGDARLTPGIYENALMTADETHPGLENGMLSSVDSLREFRIAEVEYNDAGVIVRIDATYRIQTDRLDTDSLTGAITTTSNVIVGHLQYNASTKHGTSILTNDSDADGEALSLLRMPYWGSTIDYSPMITPVIFDSSTLQATSIVADTLLIGGFLNSKLDIVAQPQHGSLTLYRDGGFIYTPNQNYSGPDSFQYRVNDGSANSNIASVSIDVLPVSNAPVGTTGTAMMTPGEAYTVKLADFGFTDPNETTSDSFVGVTFTTVPTQGVLALDGAEIADGAYVSADDIAAGKLTFTCEPGLPHAACTFQVQDSGSTDNGGVVVDPAPKTLTFDFPPVANDDAFTIEPTETVLNVLANDVDVDGDLLSIYPVSAPSHGSLKWSFTSPQQISYVPTPGYVGTDTFQYRIGDGYGSSQYATVTVNVRPAKPTISINDVTKFENADGATTTFTFTVSLSNAYDEEVSVDLATADGTATANDDYQPATGHLVWSVGDSASKTVSITVDNDTLTEEDEAYYVNLSSPVNAVLGKSQGVGTILDDETNLAPTIDNVSVPTGPLVGIATIHYTLHDRESNSCSILVEYSYDGVHWYPAQDMIAGGDGTTDLASSPEGIEHTFDWYGGLLFSGSICDALPRPIYPTTYQYSVKFRVTPSDVNSTGTAVVTDSVTFVDSIDTTPPTPNPIGFKTLPHALSSTSIGMTAEEAHDIHGVQYYFLCTTPGGHDSGWQDSPTYVDTGLSPNTSYVYGIKTRDKYVTPNEGAQTPPAMGTTLREGTVFTPVSGTSGDDVFEFHAGASASAWVLYVNGVRQSIAANTANLTIDGLGGNDTLTFYGSSAALTACIGYETGNITFGDYAFAYKNMDNVTVIGASGTDTAFQQGTSGDDVFQSLPNFSEMRTSGKFARLDHFASVFVNGKGGNDSATLYGGKGANDFLGSLSWASYTGMGFNYEMSDFDTVSVYSQPDAKNTAVFKNVRNNDILIASYLGAQYIAEGCSFDVWNVNNINASCDAGGEVRFYGSPGGNTVLNVSPDLATQTEKNITLSATGYKTFASYVNPGGNTTASFVGSLDADNAVMSQHGAQLFGNNFELSAWNYRTINFVGHGSNDTANMYAESNASNFVGTGSVATMTFGNVERKVTNFGQVVAHGNAASTATFYGVAGGTNTFNVAPTQTSMSGTGYNNVAMNFGSSMGVGSPDAIDVVNYADSTGDDVFLSSYLGSTMFGNGFSNSAWSFEKVNATSSNGNDIARFYGSSASPDTFTASPRSAKQVGSGIESHADGFALIEAYSGVGSGGTASLTGSAGDDLCVTSPLGVQFWGSNYRLEAWNYASTKIAGNGGNDLADFYGKPTNNRLVADKVFAQFSGTGFDNRVENFAKVRVHGSPAGKDTAELDHAYLESGLQETPDHPGELTIVRKIWLYDFDEIATTEKPTNPTPANVIVDKLMTAFMYE